MGPGNQLQFGTVLFEKKFDHFTVMINFPVEILGHAVSGKAGIMNIDGPTNKQERYQRTEKGQQYEAPKKLSIFFSTYS